jgi:hypothetical protein
MEKAPSYRLLDAANFNTVEGFLQPDGFFRISRESWSVLSGISALGGRSTFMSDRRKQRRRTDVTTEKENFENN